MYGNVSSAYSSASSDSQFMYDVGFVVKDISISAGSLDLTVELKAGVRSDFSGGFFSRQDQTVYFQLGFSF